MYIGRSTCHFEVMFPQFQNVGHVDISCLKVWRLMHGMENRGLQTDANVKIFMDTVIILKYIKFHLKTKNNDA